MPKTKYGHLIVTELKRNIEEAPWSPQDYAVTSGQGGRFLFLDKEVVPGAFYLETVWIMPRPRSATKSDAGVKPHVHDYDEVAAFFGTDPKDFHELGAEIEVTLGGEKHTITKSCIIFIPKGLEHGPLSFIEVRKPVFHFTSGPGKMYF